MNKIYSFVLFVALFLSGTTHAFAEIISGATYLIMTNNGNKALTNKGSSQNDVKLLFTNISSTDNGQAWILTQGSDGYWQVKSKMGEVCMDDPSVSNPALGCLIQWETNNGENQKWVLKCVSEKDSTYYLIPKKAETGTKAYLPNANNLLSLQTQTSNLALKLREIVTQDTPEPILYRISTEDGTRSLSTRGLTTNSTRLSMEENSDEGGQFWRLEKTNNKYYIKSYLGNVNIDNPNFHELIIWSAGTGDNQKWTLTPIANTDSLFYLVSNENKAYGYNDNFYLTPKNLGDAGTRLRIKTARLPEPTRMTTDGEYALQFVTTFPSYNYNAEGKYLAYSTTSNSLKLVSNYSYDECRFNITVKDGVAKIMVDGNEKYIYRNSSSLLVSPNSDTSHLNEANMSFFMSNDKLNLDTRIAWEAGSKRAILNNRELTMVIPNSLGTKITASGGVNVKNSYNLKLIPLTPSSVVNALKDIITTINELAQKATGEDAKKLNEAIEWANSELDYLYLTSKDVSVDINKMNQYTNTISQIKAKIEGISTNITESSKDDIHIKVINRIIKVEGITNYQIINANGQSINPKTKLSDGVYFVTINKNKTYKVLVK